MKLLIVLVFLYLHSSFDAFSLNDDPPIVNTKYGSIRGVSDENAYMYLGVPFAVAPVADLRWEAPSDAKPWSPLILNATNFKPACPQVNCTSRMPTQSCPTEFSEDCLYLNVFVPKTVNQTDEKKAVMVFIHGGNFEYQSGHTVVIDGRRITYYGDVIVVTLQYRLGALGFLLTGLESSQIQGNLGIKDQRLALKWIYENIGSFNGDQSRITIFGQSAGAQSVSIHVLSEDMQQYFTNAIIQSGPVSIPFRSFEEQMALYAYFADLLNCSARDVQCLKSKSMEEILSAQMTAGNQLSSFALPGLFQPWLPWLDGKLIKGQLLEPERWNVTSVKPFIIGSLPEETHLYITFAFKNPMSVTEYAAVIIAGFKKAAVKVLDHFPPDFANPDQRNLTSTMATRWLFSCSLRHYLEYAVSKSTNNQHYQYVFDYPLDWPGWDNFTTCNGHTCHGADQPYTFDSPDNKFTATGHSISLSHIAYWTNFAKYGNPNSNSEQLNWPAYNLTNKAYFKFGENSSIEVDYAKEDCNFFDSIGYYH